jgi:uncharacterized membrane protein
MNPAQRAGAGRKAGLLFLCAGLILASLLFFAPVSADATQEYSITYTISLHADNSALWTIEYRIPVNTPADQAAFEANTNSSPILSEASIGQLMEQSASEAAASTGRPMAIENFHRESAIQSSPTGTYGVIRYHFLWTNFTDGSDTMTMGDAFVGGLYVPVGASLIVELPPGYTVSSAEPAPDVMNGNLVWEGPYSFDAGQPAVVLAPAGIPAAWIIAGAFGCIAVAGIAGLLVYRWQKPPLPAPLPESDPLPPGPEVTPVSQDDLREVEERIFNLVKESGGELFQSAIVEKLGLPKSTASSAINALNARGLVQKIKKGRENLIRVVPDK